MSEDQQVHLALTAVREACGALAGAEDDAVRMFALRVDAMARALEDSVLPPAAAQGGSGG
jgi:hypothetical protein